MEEPHQVQKKVPLNIDNIIPNMHDSKSKYYEALDSNQAPDLADNLKKSKRNGLHKKRALKRITRFSDSGSDSGADNSLVVKPLLFENDNSKSDNNAKSILRKPRIQGNIPSDEEDSETQKSVLFKKIDINESQDESKESVKSPSKSPSPTNSDYEATISDSDNAIKNKEQQLRMTNKRNKLKNTFKDLLKAREKDNSQKNIENEVNTMSDTESSSEPSEEITSIKKIKQKIKERMSFKPSICDPDTSEEEIAQQESVYNQKKKKRTKLTSPKPERMSAKQAMENMQKIKSESNRMLREKEVSLPYHRPKALSLKDIMSRRKVIASLDGKAFPIKMNQEQLKKFALYLDERQKGIVEFCKRQSDEEETEQTPAEIKNIAVNRIDDSVVKVTTELINDEKIVTNTAIQTSNENAAENEMTINNYDITSKEQNSESSIQLVYDDLADSLADISSTVFVNNKMGTVNDETGNVTAITKSSAKISNDVTYESETVQQYEDSLKNNTENDSELIKLRFENTECSNVQESTDTTIVEITDNSIINEKSSKSFDQDKQTKIPTQDTESIINIPTESNLPEEERSGEIDGMEICNEFSDDDLNIEDIDNIIENAEIIKDIEDKVNSQFLVRDKPLNMNPKLTGAPGMVIDLEDSETAPRKSGVELLKERFIYFSKLKSPEEIEREREKISKPGTQLSKLKKELEEKIAEQRSLEWAKRLEKEKQQQRELKELRGEESDEDDIDKIEAAIDEKEEIRGDSDESESGEEEPIENDIVIKDKPKKRNVMLDDEAEESECDENSNNNRLIEDEKINEQNQENADYDDGYENDNGIEADNDDSEVESDSDESSESEDAQLVTKKGRILKAFEDSDEEDAAKDLPVVQIREAKGTTDLRSGSSGTGNLIASQDEDLQLAQRAISTSEDLFTSQESTFLALETKEQTKETVENDESLTQTFSILESSKQQIVELYLNSSGKSAVCVTQTLDINSIGDVTNCPVGDSQTLPLPSQITISQQSESQPIGDDILALCTGQFYNNQFISQENQPLAPLTNAINYDAFDNYQSQDSQNVASKDISHTEAIDILNKDNMANIRKSKNTDEFLEFDAVDDKENKKEKVVDDNLKSILDELADPEFDAPKPNKYFLGNSLNKDRNTNILMKRKLVIDSDDESQEVDTVEAKKPKKLKKKRPEKRALQISDDEEEPDEMEDYESDIEEDGQGRLVEYDSEENEIEIKPQNPNKKRKMPDFFENEAELTSEDEWAGSGDEDEAGLDRMEREEGDDEVFHQGKLQRELGQIHMRDVLDQDKREVRLIQELLFEDGDLGDGGRQRKFRWNNMGEEEAGTVPEGFADTQEEEFESEEQWRKQRHEREMFLRQMQNKDEPEEKLNISVNRTTIIKANLLSKTMSSILMEVENSTADKTDATVTVIKKTARDIPSPKKSLSLLQQSYQGSMLSRGRGALARLAALATPLAADDDAKVGTIGPNSRRNFVFAALTPEEKQPKVTKRKAESNPSTPKLVKKLRTEETNTNRSSLLDHFKL